MADWTQLPQELLTLTAKRLQTQFEVLRFRSVYTSWRSSSSSPRLYPLPKRLPSYSRWSQSDRGNIYTITLITRIIVFLVRCPGAENRNNQTASACWLVKIRDGEKKQLLHPLSDSMLKPVPSKFPSVLDLTKFQVIELGHEFVAQIHKFFDHPFRSRSDYYKEKVVFFWTSTNTNDFAMLTKFNGRLALLRSGQKEWTAFDNVNCVQDIICFNGKFYAIERQGRIIVIDQSFNVYFLQQHDVGSHSPSTRKFLVQSGDNLLAVEVLFVPNSEYGSSQGRKVAGFRIFRFDEETQKLDEIKSLEDQILFLGLHQAISASVSESPCDRRNLIFYSSGLSIDPQLDIPEDTLMFVFDLETGTSSPLENYPGYCNLFWPPPEWVASSESGSSSIEVIDNYNYWLTSATLENECEYPDLNSAICTREIGGKSSERVTSVDQEVGSKHSPPSSKCSFKFCCF